MTTIELYINNRLCDVGSDFSVRLNRQLLNPGELNTKDAQFSYSINLPPTSNNHAIFSYANIEETKDKFNREYRAELVINSVRVFKGLFRMSEITRDKYKGNLYIPATKSIKDIFGERTLNETPEYRIEFKDFADYISRYNRQAKSGPQMCIFPYTLYGLLPKVPNLEGKYTPSNVWDDSVRIGVQDFAPSINPLLMLRHIFDGRKRNPDGTYEGERKYKLIGTAFDDERLTRLYMSYKNDTDLEQPWNYGTLAKIHISGKWSNRYNRNLPGNTEQLERGVYESSGVEEVYACNLFDCNNAFVNVIEDPGKNITGVTRTEDGRNRHQTQIIIPTSGYYKIQLKVNTQLEDVAQAARDPKTGLLYIGAAIKGNTLTDIKTGVKLLRDWGKGEFNIAGSQMDGTLYRNNLPQDAESIPRLYPQYIRNTGMINMIDPAQNQNYLCGFQWGKASDLDVNPLDTENGLSQINIGKPAISWNADYTDHELNRIAIKVPIGYQRYSLTESGAPQWFDTELFECDLLGAPENYARRGYFEGKPAKAAVSADGYLNCVAWLNKGEQLTLVDVSNRGQMPFVAPAWVFKDITFDLAITPFRKEIEWLKIDPKTGTSTGLMSWINSETFDVDSINLAGFLPADTKTDDFIDNFCKAFNLQLTQTDATTFELNVKQTKTVVSNRYINLDKLASVRDRSNAPLGLPSLYRLGFTIDAEEEGYVTTGDDGGGEFETGAAEEKIIEQKSSFSYNWFKTITKQQGNAKIALPLAVISKHEVWVEGAKYGEAMEKRYTDLAARFWYYAGLLNDRGADFSFNNVPIMVAEVSNEIPGVSILNYKNRRYTILDNYFTLLINGSSHYTEIEGYLAPDQYEDLNGSTMAMFNGDLYYVAEISGYDPTGRNKSKIKLIRKI